MKSASLTSAGCADLAVLAIPSRLVTLSRLAGRYLGPADPLLPGTGGCRRPVLAPRAGGL